MWPPNCSWGGATSGFSRLRWHLHIALHPHVAFSDLGLRGPPQRDAAGSIRGDGGSSAHRTHDGGQHGPKRPAVADAGGTQTHTLTSTEMPTHSHSVTDPGHTHGISEAQAAATTVGGLLYRGSVNLGNFPITVQSATTEISLANAGSGGAHANVQPTICCDYIMRII